MQLHRLLYPGLAGLMGAQSVLFAKCRCVRGAPSSPPPRAPMRCLAHSAELLKTTLADRGVMFAHMGSYVILATMTMTLVMQVRRDSTQRIAAAVTHARRCAVDRRCSF